MSNLIFLILIGSAIGVAAGYLGSFMVLKRMSLVGDALTHVALPGMAIALTYGLSPTLGALIALTLAIFGIWYLDETTDVYPEALVGIFFTASLALGLLITPEPELLEALFGNIEKIGLIEGLVTVCISLLVIIFTWLISQKILMGVVSEELAKAMKVSVSKYNLLYLLLVGVIVAMGVKFVGTLLMGALVIIPAAAAKNVSRGIKSYYLFSAGFGLISAIIGILAANLLNVSSGPAVVLSSVLIFIATYLIKK
jgi:ABC-type Mn2+/Zn2+ transport system permease subunit